MRINGPDRIVFSGSATQLPLSINAIETAGAIQYAVTSVPSGSIAVRKTATAAPLTSGAALTVTDAANLVVTRSASGGGTGSLGQPIAEPAIVGLKSRAYATGASPTTWRSGDQGNVDAAKAGNLWIPDYPPAGSGTVTLDLLFDIGSAITLGTISDLVLSIAYGGDPNDQWGGVSANAIASSDGTSVTVLNSLTSTPVAGNTTTQRTLAGSVSGAPTTRWVGVRLSNMPRVYPTIFRGWKVQDRTGAGTSFDPIPMPVTFQVRATDTVGSGAATVTDNNNVVAARRRYYTTGTSAPSFVAAAASEVTAIHDGNYFLTGFPPSGSGTCVIDLLFDTGDGGIPTRLDDFLMSFGYGGDPVNQWSGVTAKAIASTNGSTVTVLNALTISTTATDPTTLRSIAGPISGASAARWVGVRLTGAPKNYPCVFRGFRCTRSGNSTSTTADYSVAIGDENTNFGGTVTPTPPAPTPTPSGNATVYGDPGSRFAIGLTPAPSASTYALTIPAGLKLQLAGQSEGTSTAGSTFTATNVNGPFAPSQSSGGATNAQLSAFGSGRTFDGTSIFLPRFSYLATPALGLSFASSNDASRNQAPRGLTLSFVGVVPADSRVIAAVQEFGTGGMILLGNWAANNLIVRIKRNGNQEELTSINGISNTSAENVGVRWVDNPAGSGGTLTFLRNGAPFGPAQTTATKPRVTPAAALEVNALTGNGTAGTDLKVRQVGLIVDQVIAVTNYTDVASGAVTAEQLRSLSVDARAVGTPQPAQTLTYQASGQAVEKLDVVIGPLAVPAGVAYRAVLENWSTGSAVSHPNALVMTKPVRQLCRFEDADLVQTPWTECLPQGPTPVINGIAYRCEAIRTGDYVQFQFGYDWDTSAMPANPFGDPRGKDSYMVAHKWRIEDTAGNVLARLERPDGGALNRTDVPRIFQGSYDGRGVAITNSSDRWYPHGTVRSGIIWRSRTPDAYPQAIVSAKLPRYDVTVPYAMHTDYSTNGFDLRIYMGGAGGDGQSNGFGNTRVIPWDPTNYATLVPKAGVTQDPFKGSLYTANSLAAVGSTWMRYTPFNQSGRSPLTGPGGIRDERAMIPEPAAQYMYDVNAVRPHDGRSWAQLSLDYLTAYVSDPFHCFEAGRCVPLFKGVNAGRTITLRNHYYGAGEASTPPERAYYMQSGRVSDIVAQSYPLRVPVPEVGSAADKPYFGMNAIDAAHAHQFPHWGSLLWKTPEFAFLGHKFWDQTRLYANIIVAEPYAERWANREGAWAFMHATLAWKTAATNSDRLYSRAEVLDYVVADLESFSDQHLTGSVGFNSPPTDVLTGGQIDTVKSIYAAAQYFGPVLPIDGSNTIGQHDFMIGYWLTALGMAEKLGFNAAIRSRSTKAASVLTFMIAQHRKRVIGRVNTVPNANLLDDGYLFQIWPSTKIKAVGGVVNQLPRTWSAVATQNGNAPSWDLTAGNGTAVTRDGQPTDQLLAAPSVLKLQLGQTGLDLDTAVSNAASRRAQKKGEQEALGVNAGSTWFRYLNACNNPAVG